MKTFKIQDAKTTFFTDKNHYLAFTQAWKDYINSGKHKKPQRTDPEVRTYSSLTFQYHILYQALRGKDIGKCITPIQDSNKLMNNGGNPYICWNQLYWLRYIGSAAKNKDQAKADRIAGNCVNELSKVFGDTITIEMLHKLSDSIPDISTWQEV